MEVQKIPKRTVTLIEPKKSILVDKEKYHQKRVAAYCRVSTDSEEQLTSYAYFFLRHSLFSGKSFL